MMRREVSWSTTALGPDGHKRAIYRVYYVCAIECPSRWGLNDAVLVSFFFISVWEIRMMTCFVHREPCTTRR